MNRCTVCDDPAEHRLFSTNNAVVTGSGDYKPAPPVPLCRPHQAAIASQEVPFPDWCPDCDAWRPAPHRHVA